MNLSFSPNYLALLISVIAAMALGFLWYGPFFGKTWMKLTGIRKEDVNGPMTPYIIKGLINTAVMMTAGAFFIGSFSASHGWQGALIGSLLALGICGPTLYSQVNWEGKPVKLFLIHTGYYFCSLSIAGTIFTAWPA